MTSISSKDHFFPQPSTTTTSTTSTSTTTIPTKHKASISAATPNTSNTSTFRRTDVVKSGQLLVKKSAKPFKFKRWHERVLVLRDTWTEACHGGVSSLEVYHPPPNSSTTPTHPSKPLPIQTKSSLLSCLSCVSKNQQKYVQNSQISFSKFSINSLPTHHHKHLSKNHLDHCYIDLSTVSSVNAHSSKSLPHAFILHRKDKEEVVFGAKSDLEAREWMMAIRHLAEKAHQPAMHKQPPTILSFEDRLETMRRQSRDQGNIPAKEGEQFPNVPKPPPRPKARKSDA